MHVDQVGCEGEGVDVSGAWGRQEGDVDKGRGDGEESRVQLCDVVGERLGLRGEDGDGVVDHVVRHCELLVMLLYTLSWVGTELMCGR